MDHTVDCVSGERAGNVKKSESMLKNAASLLEVLFKQSDSFFLLSCNYVTLMTLRIAAVTNCLISCVCV